MALVTATELLSNGVHFGHQTRRWNPKMKRFIFTERNGIYIIDLHQTVACLDAAYTYIRDTVARGGQILFVGTKKQAQEAVADQANRVGMPYVNQRWLGGMLTNFPTMVKRIQRLKELEAMDLGNVSSGLTKKERLGLSRERDKLAKSLGGIRDMGKVPSAIWVVDTKKEHLAIDEARKLKIPVVAILDTNCDPDEVDYPVPGNDDAIRAVSLLTRIVADAVADGLMVRSQAPFVSPDSTEAELIEPMPDWERELLAGGLADVAPVAPIAVVSPVAPVEAVRPVDEVKPVTPVDEVTPVPVASPASPDVTAAVVDESAAPVAPQAEPADTMGDVAAAAQDSVTGEPSAAADAATGD